MRVLFTEKEPGRIEFALIYGGLVILLLAAARFLPVATLAPDCTFRALTGLPCPTCGSTRSVMLLSRGQILPAFSLNPLTTVVCIAVLLAFAYRISALLLNLPRIAVQLSARDQNLIRFCAVVTLFLNWIYLVIVL